MGLYAQPCEIFMGSKSPPPIRADDVSPAAIGTQVIAALRQMATELENGALLIVDPSRTRLRVLPLQLRH